MPTLKNMGNTCYLNSALQLIFYSNNIMQQIMQSSFPSNLIISQLQTIYKQTQLVQPSELKQIIEAKYPQFYGNEQQDSHEFLSFILQELFQNLPSIQQLFQFSERLQTMCTCGYKVSQITTNIQLLLSIQITKPIKIKSRFFNFNFINEVHIPGDSLNDLITEYLKKQVSLNTCPKCNDFNMYTQSSFVSLPQQLLIIITRFTYNTKIQAQIQFDENLFLQNEHFKLKSVIMHAGTLNQGHYTCVSEKDGKWWEISDERQYQISLDSRDSRAYILSYEKQLESVTVSD
ncbi:Ubiquitin carboxyl-terminal hydrolase family protein [Spironucleus salmonicida]|uniref:Ubiquitin carboxyl-terminal hydrolase family protein n=1 Tax=Spironucleus salmonicida TaxID=348837 RepID=V6LGP1_9EUKA|nr:Ubiquitin carboxyl-terminal hydrolase family protein [Spironucleus salmonicida]|eukprot:EST43705.1 Ubiquitin carboxyl-terminal hydrolase family protein [Spironucleus salmonicida]